MNARTVNRTSTVSRAVRRGTFTALLLSCLIVPPVGATVIHGDYFGTNVDFLGVSETTQTAGDAEPLWNAPVLGGTGDSLIFAPSSFISSAQDAATDATSSLLQMDLIAGSGLSLLEFALQIFGISTLDTDSSPGTRGTNAAVSLAGTLTVLEDLNGPMAPVVIPFSASFSPKASFFLPDDLGAVQWIGDVSIDIAAIVPNASRASLSVDAFLLTDALTGTSANLQLSGVSIDVRTDAPPTPAPVPGTLALILLGLAGFKVRKRLSMPSIS